MKKYLKIKKILLLVGMASLSLSLTKFSAARQMLLTPQLTSQQELTPQQTADKQKALNIFELTQSKYAFVPTPLSKNIKTMIGKYKMPVKAFTEGKLRSLRAKKRGECSEFSAFYVDQLLKQNIKATFLHINFFPKDPNKSKESYYESSQVFTQEKGKYTGRLKQHVAAIYESDEDFFVLDCNFEKEHNGIPFREYADALIDSGWIVASIGIWNFNIVKDERELVSLLAKGDLDPLAKNQKDWKIAVVAATDASDLSFGLLTLPDNLSLDFEV